MTYFEFAEKKPVLYGHITHNGKRKSGQFRPCWNKWSNSLCYQYFTEKGRKGAGGFTLRKAHHLFINGRLHLAH